MNQQERIVNAHNKPYKIQNQKFHPKFYTLYYPMNDLACTMPIRYDRRTVPIYYATTNANDPNRNKQNINDNP